MVTIVSTQPHRSVIKECVCKNCGATLQYVPADVKEVKSYDYGGGYDINKVIGCPACGSNVYVNGNSRLY